MVEPMRNVKCDGCGGVPAFNKRLPCHHIYCGACIDDMEAAAREGSQPMITCQSLSCGAVHHIPEGAGSLPSDESVARMVENLGRLELSDLCSSAGCGKEVYKFDCKHCHKSFCHDCFIQHFKDCISEKISFYESAIPHFCDLEQQLLQNKASIQSARTEMYGKIRSCISRLEEILNDSMAELDQREAAIDAKLSDISKITANPEFHVEAKSLLSTLDDEWSLLDLLKKSFDHAVPTVQHSPFSQLTYPLTCHFHDDSELTEAINNFRTISFDAPPEPAICEGAVGPLMLWSKFRWITEVGLC